MNEKMITDKEREEIVRTFVAEAEESFAAMEQVLLLLEGDPHNHDLLDELFRAVHSVKGNAGCLGFDEIGALSHEIEEMLDHVRAGVLQLTPSRMSTMLDSVDVLRQLLELLPGSSATAVAGDAVANSSNELAVPEAGGTAPVFTPAQDENAGNRNSARRTLRIGTEKLDRMLDLSGEIAIARGHLRQLVEQGAPRDAMLDALREMERLSFDLHEAVMDVRLVPIGPALRHVHRVVRDLSASHGKQVTLSLEGEDVELDMTVIEHLRDPITHMIRNAIAHGIERPEERVAAGKPAAGSIRISASHQAGGVVIRFSDDGAGLDERRIAERAHALGIDTERLSRHDLLALIFQPGFSTAANVTDLSGRGVGMDVVRRNVERLRGSISVDAQPGAGTTISVRLPLTLTLIEGFAVSAGDDTFIAPIESIVECVEMPAGADRGGATAVINVRGEALPCLRLRSLFDIDGPPAVRENVIVVEHGSQRAGIIADALLGATRTVVKPLGRVFHNIPGIAGSSILGSGRIGLILDVPEILRRAAEPAFAAA
ncbi:MAG TPA: chemotaxis protein CheA [Thermoanaerobaculia bacterium]|nr:chemotaxis protein CheA [Thermoanaerobaculia bacterium]